MSLFKRFLCPAVVLLVLLSLFSFSALAEDNFIGLTAPKTARLGDTITVNLNISGTHSDIASFGPVTVAYDANKLTYKSCAKGGAVTSNFIVTGVAAAGIITITGKQVASSDVIPSNVYTVVALTFDIKTGIPLGDVSFSVKSATGFIPAGGNADSFPKINLLEAATMSLTEKLSDDATLSSLTIDGYTLSPAFTPATANGYYITVPNGVTSIKVDAKPTQAAAKVNSITGNTNLALGSNTVTVLVTAPDGKTQIAYSISVVRESEVVSSVSSDITETVSEPDSSVAPVPTDDMATLQHKYDQLSEKLFVVVVLFIVVIASLICYIIYLLIKTHN